MNRTLVVGALAGALLAKLAAPKRARKGGTARLLKGAILGALAAVAAPSLGVRLPLLAAVNPR